MQRPLGFAGVVLACMALCLGTAVGQDTIEEEPILLLQGLAKLAPTEGATNQDALGVAHLRQIAERIAIHVHVQNLEPGAAYDVVLTLAGETEPVPLGTITTHDGVPPPPRCFSGQLTAVEEPPDEEGEPEDLGEGDGGHLRGDMPLPEHGDWRDWRDRLHRDRPMAPRGSAYLLLNEDGTELSYTISTRGIGEVESASLTIGEGAPYDVTELRGSIPVSPEEIEALQAGEGTVAVIGTEATVEGSLSPCIPQEWRDRMATRKAGRGSLRLDTARGDEVPVDTLVGLEGATIDVLPTGGEADAVLTGVVGEIVDLEIRCGHWRPRPPPPGDEPEEPAEGETEAVDVGGRSEPGAAR